MNPQDQPDRNINIAFGKTNALSSGELTKGMFITFLESRQKTIQLPTPSGMVEIKVDADKGSFGEILEVRAVQLPYIVVVHHQSNGGERQRHKVDTRDFTFMELRADYVKELLGIIP